MIEMNDLTYKEFSFGGKNEPQQQLAVALDSDHLQHGIWESGPGELNLDFEWDETVFILEGEAIVRNLETQECFKLTQGSLANFSKGSRWQWQIPWKLKKVFTIVVT